jgi:hypothetical protein
MRIGMGRGFMVSTDTLDYTHLKKHIDLWIWNHASKGKKRKKSHLYTTVLFGAIIIMWLGIAFGFTNAVKERIKKFRRVKMVVLVIKVVIFILTLSLVALIIYICVI